MREAKKNLLSALEVKGAKPQKKAYTLLDGAGLNLVVEPSGKKWWRYRATFAGKGKLFSFGEYPAVTLSQARAEREKINGFVANNIDPAAIRKAAKATESGAGSFEAIAREWHSTFISKWSESHAKTILTRLEKDCFPYVGKRPIGEITVVEMVAVLERIAKRTLETAHRVQIACGQVYRYAGTKGYTSSNPMTVMKGLLPPVISKPMASTTEPKDVAPLLRMLDGYQGSFPVVCALKLSPLVFVRPGELRQALWADVDLDNAEWKYYVTKTKKDHIVPLSRQAVEILTELYPLTGAGKYVFPSSRTATRPMSENTVNAAMRRMGIDTRNELTGHGFRAMARTILDEVLGIRPDYIEHQLAHAVKDPNGRAYNRTAHLPARRDMMQKWSDYLDKLKRGAEIIPIRAAG